MVILNQNDISDIIKFVFIVLNSTTAWLQLFNCKWLIRYVRNLVSICYCSYVLSIWYDATIPACEVVFRYTDGQYQFSDVLPGHYEVLIDNDVFCWENPSYRISITSEHAEVPPFKQTGFSITFISSHDTAVEYSEPNSTKLITLPLSKGSTRHCVSKFGAYIFVPKGCHIYEKHSYIWDTSNLSPILLHSTEHTHIGNIISSSIQNDLTVKIEDTSDNIM